MIKYNWSILRRVSSGVLSRLGTVYAPLRQAQQIWVLVGGTVTDTEEVYKCNDNDNESILQYKHGIYKGKTYNLYFLCRL